jgi:membrane protein
LKAELQTANQKKTERARQFFSYFWSNFFSDSCLQHATALSYTTLLSLVPLMAVMLSVFTAFPLFEDVSLQVQNFVFENFVPASGEVVQQYIQQFSANASKLTGPGLISLVITSIMMMAAIDNSLNKIWHNSKSRRPVARFVVYWSVLTLGPVLIGVSLAISSYIVSLPLLSETASYGEKLGLLRVLPFFMEALAFTLLYVVVPNCRVAFRSALIGGLAAALLFELAKKGFSFYITSFPAYETIYGAMSTVPVFLVWIFLSWSITLMGAEFAWCLDTFSQASHGAFCKSEKEAEAVIEEGHSAESVDSRLARIEALLARKLKP